MVLWKIRECSSFWLQLRLLLYRDTIVQYEPAKIKYKLWKMNESIKGNICLYHINWPCNLRYQLVCQVSETLKIKLNTRSWTKSLIKILERLPKGGYLIFLPLILSLQENRLIKANHKEFQKIQLFFTIRFNR